MKQCPSILSVLSAAILCFMLTCVCCRSWATTPKSMDIAFSFPDQGISVKRPAQVKVTISPGRPLKEVKIETIPTAVKLVNSGSTIENISIKKLPNISYCREQCSFDIPLIVKDNGEYEIRVAITAQQDNEEVYRSRAFGIVSEDGVVWFGRESVGHAIEAKILQQVETESIHFFGDNNKKYQEMLKQEEEKRALKSRNNAQRGSSLF